jgi:hypothetical protein
MSEVMRADVRGKAYAHGRRPSRLHVALLACFVILLLYPMNSYMIIKILIRIELSSSSYSRLPAG